jgi:cell division transport system permease protein
MTEPKPTNPAKSGPKKPVQNVSQNNAKNPKEPVKPRARKLRSGHSIVPRETIASKALIFVIGIMAFLACLTLGGVSMVNSSAERWQSDISREVTIQILPSDNTDMAAAIRRASDIALSFDGVAKVTVLNSAETARLLEPWLGAGLDLQELPIPRLLTVALTGDVKPDFSAMREKLKAEIPDSSLDDHRAWVDRLTTMALTMVAIGMGIFLLVMAATVTTVVFATRGAMAGNQDVVEVLHFVGADSQFISSQFQRHFLFLGFKGALSGAAGAIVLFIILSLWSSASLATPEGDQINALFGSFSLSWSGYFGMIIVLFLVAALTALTSRWTVHRQVNTLQNYRK